MHLPVLLKETIEALNIKPGDTIVDATVNGGGHAEEICRKLGEKGIFIGIDLDTDALTQAKKRLKNVKCTVFLEQSNYRELDSVLSRLDIHTVHSVLFDFGFSTNQLNTSGRGFSFQKDEPLLMTFKNEAELKPTDLTAREIVNDWEEEHIKDIIKGYGEERFAGRIARVITEERKKQPIQTTSNLVDVIHKAVPKWYTRQKTHFATKTFQALRMTVNNELGSIQEGLLKAFEAVKPQGRIVTISFHSAEDRIAKQFFKKKMSEGVGVVITKKPITPSKKEVLSNPRARSAKLRVFEIRK